MAEKTVLAGRTFIPVGVSTLAHDIWFTEQYLAAGIDNVVQGLEETDDDYAARLLRAVLASGKTFKMLGALIVPEEVGPEGWTPEVADATAHYIAELRSEEDKKQAYAVLMSMMIGFFGSGPKSLRPSRSSLASEAGGADRPGAETAMGGGVR